MGHSAAAAVLTATRPLAHLLLPSVNTSCTKKTIVGYLKPSLGSDEWSTQRRRVHRAPQGPRGEVCGALCGETGEETCVRGLCRDVRAGGPAGRRCGNTRAGTVWGDV